MTKRQEREEFIAILASEFPDRPSGQVLTFARALMRRATTAQRYAETLCSVEMTRQAQERMEKADEQNDAAIEALCKPWGITPVFQGDPRGALVKLKVPSGRTNDWGNIGICVPSGR